MDTISTIMQPKNVAVISTIAELSLFSSIAINCKMFVGDCVGAEVGFGVGEWVGLQVSATSDKSSMPQLVAMLFL